MSQNNKPASHLQEVHHDGMDKNVIELSVCLNSNPLLPFFTSAPTQVVAPLSRARWYHRDQIPREVGPMNRKPHPQNLPCPRRGATHGIQNSSQGGRPRWVCRNGGRSFGPTLGTAMDRWRATPTEATRTLRVGMRRGSRSAAEAITGHKVETIRRWRWAAARHAEALTEVRVHDRHRSEECLTFLHHQYLRR
jgi:transposase-like protein